MLAPLSSMLLNYRNIILSLQILNRMGGVKGISSAAAKCLTAEGAVVFMNVAPLWAEGAPQNQR